MISSINFLNRFFLFFAVCLGISVLLVCATDTTAFKQQTLPEQSGPGRLLIAVLPFENLSGKAAPLKPLRQAAVNRLKALGFSILDDTTLERFMVAHRLRYTGGLDARTAQELKSELGIGAVLITTVELYDEAAPPKIALFSRLVSTGEPTSILWINSVSLAGDESPGILGLGLIENPAKLIEKALGRLFGSIMMDHRSGKTGTMNKGGWGYRPRAVFASPVLQRNKRYTIAVVPFTNKSVRRNAGDLIELNFAEQLLKSGDFEVVEPGIVRQDLLNMRLVAPEGISLSDIDILFSLLDTDLLLIGNDFEYQDPQGQTGTPKVEFSTFLIDRTSRRIIWSSGSHNEGDDYIYAFDWGKVYTAHELASRMAARVVRMQHEKLFSKPQSTQTETSTLRARE